MTLRVWTDGSSSSRDRSGGWAWVTEDGRSDSGWASGTTNQRMEIKAAVQAVRSLASEPLVVVSDSQYVVRCMKDGWWRRWSRNGWLTAAKKPVINADLWRELLSLCEEADVSFEWVKGHSGDRMNAEADRLAGLARKAGLQSASKMRNQ